MDIVATSGLRCGSEWLLSPRGVFSSLNMFSEFGEIEMALERLSEVDGLGQLRCQIGSL